MKKLLACLMAFSLFVFPLAACSSPQKQGDDDKIQVVCTIFPQYDWTREIIGDSDKVELTLLVDNGVDLHSFQPSAEDIATISNCDLFIYGGGESDAWVEDVLQTAANKDMVVINMMDVLSDTTKAEEITEGMEHGHAEETTEGMEHEHADEVETDGSGENAGEYECGIDEHVWLSLKNAQIVTQHIADALGALHEEDANGYQSRAQAYNEKLALLDDAYQNTVKEADRDTLLFADRFPFRYLVDDYGINYYAAFPGCSSETEASFETVIKLAGLIDELGLQSVMVTEGSDEALAKTIIENTSGKNQQILALDSMQSITADEIASGATYLSVMEKNLEVLKEALNS